MEPIAKRIKENNILRVFISTSLIMIFTEITSVIAVLIDGVVASKLISLDTYSGISLVNPFSSILSVITGFISTGGMIVCSGFVGQGKKKNANEVFNISAFISLIAAALVVLACIFIPSILLTICGVDIHKYPELNDHMYGYLDGFMYGIPAYILIAVMGPMIVMDSGKKLFTVSSVVLCVGDIIGDVLNALVFRGGAFGMGLATSISYMLQLIVLLYYFFNKESYFKISLKFLAFKHLPALIKNGTPAFVKKIAGTLRDIFLNYINMFFALTAVAIAARGIQNDLFKFLFCIPTGLGRTLITMTRIYYSANDKKGLKNLYSSSLRVGILFSGIASVFTFIAAPLLTKLYSNDPDVLDMAVFSIRWMSVALVFDTIIVLFQHYLQGTDNLSKANKLSFIERFLVPVVTAFVLGLFFGSKGILASVAVGKILLLVLLIIQMSIKRKGFAKNMEDIMYLPEGFGGEKSDNQYSKINTMEDVIKESERTKEFCKRHGLSNRTSLYMALFVEEMAANVLQNAKEEDYVCINMRLYIEKDKVCLNMMDLGTKFDPTAFYELNKEERSEKHIGIRMVSELADEVRYYNTFDSNNLVVSISK